ncbi:MAG: hypothetical protein WCE76_10870, partial [Mycobacterium sp.]
TYWRLSAMCRARPSGFEIREVEVLEVYEESGLPATARLKASATVGTDSYTLPMAGAGSILQVRQPHCLRRRW